MYGQDPFVFNYNGFKHLIESVDESKIQICIINPETMRRVTHQVVWDDPDEFQVWAPEMHYIYPYWFIYYSASDGNNANHRMKVLCGNEPFGRFHKASNALRPEWGIDMTTFEWDNKRYAVWSGWEEGQIEEFPQNLYIAPMESPVQVGERVLLSRPEFDWELSIKPINEGPQAFVRGDRLHLLYSANASWMPEYATGVLELIAPNPLNPWHWTKCSVPIMQNVGHGMVCQDTFWYHRKMSTMAGWIDREICKLPSGEIVK